MKNTKLMPLVIAGTLLLCGCGSIDSGDSSDKTSSTVIVEQGTEIISDIMTTASEELKKETTTVTAADAVTEPSTEAMTASDEDAAKQWKIAAEKISSSKCSYKCRCEVIDPDHTFRATYESKSGSVKGIEDFVNDFEPQKYNAAPGYIDQDHTVSIDCGKTKIKLASGMVTVYGYDSVENLTKSSEPAIALCIDGGEQFTYLVSRDTKNEFDAHVEASAKKNGEITNIYEFPDNSYQEITDSYPKETIVFVSSYSNYAWGREFNGSFIDSCGYVYKFDIGDRDILSEVRERESNDEIQFDEALINVLYYDYYYKDPPVAKTDPDVLSDALAMADCIDKNADFPKENAACDAGSRCISVVDSSYSLIRLKESGDIDGYLDDDVAKELVKAYGSLQFEQINE